MQVSRLDRSAAGIGATIILASALASAQPPLPMCIDPVRLLVLDEEAIDNGKAPNRFTDKDVNVNTADIGSRLQLKYFAARPGMEIDLPSGQVGDEGWFALKTVPGAWNNAGPVAGDGLRNFWEAGPGLGRPNSNGDREALLDKVSNVTPLRAAGLARLQGTTVCAVVQDGDVSMNYNPLNGSLKGKSLGVAAFQVLSAAAKSKNSSSTLPYVRIRILDAATACSGQLAAYLDAPAPNSSSQPRDVNPPACGMERSLLTETWDAFDSSTWTGDGDELVAGGVFQARPDAQSAYAVWNNACPVNLGETSMVRFSSRVQLLSQAEKPFAQSGALFLVHDGSFADYLFIDVGYTLSPSKVYVEIFGEIGGLSFDEFSETELEFAPNLTFDLDSRITGNAVEVAVNGEVVNSLPLSSTLTALQHFEVGVQKAGNGLEGRLDHTSLIKTCAPGPGSPISLVSP